MDPVRHTCVRRAAARPGRGGVRRRRPRRCSRGVAGEPYRARLITGHAFDTVADVLRHVLRGQLAAPPRQRSSPSTGDRIASPASCVSRSLSATDPQCRCPAQLVTGRRWFRRGWKRGWGTALEGPTAARSDHRTFRRRRARAGPLTRLHSGRLDAITSSCPCSITSGGTMPLSVRPDVAVQRREERRGPGRARTPRHRPAVPHRGPIRQGGGRADRKSVV